MLVDCDTQGQVAKFLGEKPLYGLYEFVTERPGNGHFIARNDTIHPCRKNLWILEGGIRLVELKNWLGEPNPGRSDEPFLPKNLSRKKGGWII